MDSRSAQFFDRCEFLKLFRFGVHGKWFRPLAWGLGLGAPSTITSISLLHFFWFRPGVIKLRRCGRNWVRVRLQSRESDVSFSPPIISYSPIKNLVLTDAWVVVVCNDRSPKPELQTFTSTQRGSFCYHCLHSGSSLPPSLSTSLAISCLTAVLIIWCCRFAGPVVLAGNICKGSSCTCRTSTCIRKVATMFTNSCVSF